MGRCGRVALCVLALACASPQPRAGPVAPADLAALRLRASRARSLPFLAPVEVRSLAPEQVQARLARELDRVAPPAVLAGQQALQRALGLLPADADLRRDLLELQSGAVLGFFTPLDRTLFVVAGAAASGPLFESVAVHELVHALQAQHSQIPDATLGLDDRDDLVFALGALLEGDATWATERDQARARGVPVRAAADTAREIAQMIAEARGRGTPRWLRELFLRPYALGHALVEALAAAGGTGALDAAYRDPPLSSEELLHPERYLGARRPLPRLRVDARSLRPAAGCAAAVENTYGEIGLRTWALEVGAAADAARRAADGWDGDRALLWRCPQADAVAWLVQLDGERDAGEFLELARQHAAGPGLRAEREGRRVLLSAGLGRAARGRLLRETPVERVADLPAYLALRPEVSARARALRAAAGSPR